MKVLLIHDNMLLIYIYMYHLIGIHKIFSIYFYIVISDKHKSNLKQCAYFMSNLYNSSKLNKLKIKTISNQKGHHCTRWSQSHV